MRGCSQDANFGLLSYVIERKKLVRIVQRMVGVELSKRSPETGASTLENVAGATAAYCPMSCLTLAAVCELQEAVNLRRNACRELSIIR
jgi:hypothetical protein